MIALLFALSAHAFAVSNVDEACKTVVQAFNRCEPGPIQLDAKKHFVKIGKEEIPCSDGARKAPFARMNEMDVVSTLEVSYKTGQMPVPVRRGYEDPGRFRHPKLFAAAYGKDEHGVKANLTSIDFLGQQIQFNRMNGAADSLARVSRRLEKLAASDPKVNAFLKPWLDKTVDLKTMTFKWRPIAGTKMISMHSYALAIDLLTGKEPKPTYWLWDAAKQAHKDVSELKEAEIGAKYKPGEMTDVPWNVVEAFEHEGFIWGGKWNHFDTMHFEYRPEFFNKLPSCAACKIVGTFTKTRTNPDLTIRMSLTNPKVESGDENCRRANLGSILAEMDAPNPNIENGEKVELELSCKSATNCSLSSVVPAK